MGFCLHLGNKASDGKGRGGREPANDGCLKGAAENGDTGEMSFDSAEKGKGGQGDDDG